VRATRKKIGGTIPKSKRQKPSLTRQFVGAEGVGSGRDDELAELPRLAASEGSRLVVERTFSSASKSRGLRITIPVSC